MGVLCHHPDHLRGKEHIWIFLDTLRSTGHQHFIHVRRWRNMAEWRPCEISTIDTHYSNSFTYRLEITSKAIVYGLFFGRNGFQWRNHLPKRFQKVDPVPYQSNPKGPHALSLVNSVHSRSSTNNEKSQPPPVTETAPPAPDPDEAPAHAPFFRSYYNRLDAVVVISYWIDFTFMLVGVREVYIFKAISTLRPLRLLSLTEGTSVGCPFTHYARFSFWVTNEWAFL